MLTGPEEQSKPKVEFFSNQAYVFRSKISLKGSFLLIRLTYFHRLLLKVSLKWSFSQIRLMSSGAK